MVRALFFSALNSFSKKRPKNCASILVDLILSCLDAPSDVNVDELFELCSASCPSSTCVKLSLVQQVISDEIYMICESLAYREMERQLTCTDSYGENFVSTSALLRYSDYISSDDHVIAIFVHMTELVTDYIVYIFPQDELASTERYNSGNTLVLDNEFSQKVLTFLENLYQGPNIPGKKQLHNLYLSNSSNNPYPISTIITQFQHSLKYLEIDAKCIYGEDLNPLCQVLASSKNLISFSFIGNCTSLFLPDLLASLTTTFKTICKINLEGCDLPSEAFSKSSANLCRINPDHYSMSYNEMEVSFVSTLANHFQKWKLFQSLSLSHCNITSEMLTYLLEGMKECKNLYALNLSNNKIGGEGCTNLARAFLHQSKTGCTYLRELNLSHCDIGDNGILMLADLIKEISANLFSFDIGGNRLSIVGANEISTALQACKNLVELGLELPELQNFDRLNMAYHKSFIKSILNVLQTTFKLRKLLLSNLQLDNAQAQYIAEIIRRKFLKKLKLSNCCNKESKLEPLFMRQGLFQTLDLSHNTFSSNNFDILCRSLKSCKFLSYVNLRGISIFKSDEALQLQNLDISWTVQEIYLDNTNLLAGIYRVAEIIVKCEKLRVLSISDCNIGDIGAIEIANGLKHCLNLQILDLRYNNIISDTISSILAILCECCNLQILA